MFGEAFGVLNLLFVVDINGVLVLVTISRFGIINGAWMVIFLHDLYI
jgi:hypothetical protein